MVPLLYTLTLATSLVSSVAAHGIVKSLNIGGKTFSAAQVFRKYEGQDPIYDTKGSKIICNNNPSVSSTKSVASVNPGQKITFNWEWTTDRHPGPINTWLARCGDSDTSCNGFDVTKAKWFKIDEVGLIRPTGDGGFWASDQLQDNGMKWTSTVPQGIKSGAYILRHEIIAMHLVAKPEFYPGCAHLKIGGSGTGVPSADQTVSIPGFLADGPSQKALKTNIFNNIKSFDVAGPNPVKSFSGSSSSGSKSKASSAADVVDTPETDPTATEADPTATDDAPEATPTPTEEDDTPETDAPETDVPACPSSAPETEDDNGQDDGPDDGPDDGQDDGEDDTYDYSKRFVRGIKRTRHMLNRLNNPIGKRRLARLH